MVFCNITYSHLSSQELIVTILILVDGFLQFKGNKRLPEGATVTILILVDGFLQSIFELRLKTCKYSHNPYFSRWFSAMKYCKPLTLNEWYVTILILVDGFLQ